MSSNEKTSACARLQAPSRHGGSHRLEFAAALALAQLAAGCEPEFVVGTWSCKGTVPTDAGAVAGMATDAGPPLAVPWSTSFEDGFCSYADPGGSCYSDPGASYKIVTSPVHSGRFAAAFSVDSSLTTARQTRCFRQGVLPTAAYYGAWYLIPSLQTNSGNWNLFHFQGADTVANCCDGLWDVSLVNDASGNLNLTVFDFLGNPRIGADTAPPVPIGTWFHLQIYLRRAADATGEITVYQDGVVAYHLVNLVTDNTMWAQWYVGNLATALMPAESTIYVDDVEISETQ